MQPEPTVVLVDDDKSVRDALKWLIESVEYRVETYASANEFLESFDPAAPGCLVLDVRMPGMSGLELQENLVAHQCGLPVIIITGHADITMCVRAFRGGAFAFLEEPVNQQDLLEQIEKAIEKDRKNRQESMSGVDIRTESNPAHPARTRSHGSAGSRPLDEADRKGASDQLADLFKASHQRARQAGRRQRRPTRTTHTCLENTGAIGDTALHSPFAMEQPGSSRLRRIVGQAFG